MEAEATILRISKQPVCCCPVCMHHAKRYTVSKPLTTRLYISCTQGVLGCIVVNKDGAVLRSTCEVRAPNMHAHTQRSLVRLWALNTCAVAQAEVTKAHAQLIPDLAALARNMVRDLDPQVREHYPKWHSPLCCKLQNLGEQAVAVSEHMWCCVQNELEFLRIRSRKYEIMVAPSALCTSLCSTPNMRQNTGV